MDHALDQRHGEPVGNRCHQPDPQRREPRGQNRDRHDQPAKAADAGKLLHHAFEGEGGGADVVDAGGFPLEGERQIAKDVVDRDRLHLIADPPRCNHRRQPFGQVADHLE